MVDKNIFRCENHPYRFIRGKILLLFFFFSFMGLSFGGETNSLDRLFEQANAFYKENKFDQAISGYNKIIEQGLENGNIYYNLANSYFKKGELGKAILNYERARIFMPSDSDLKSNYEYAYSLAGLDKAPKKASERIFAGLNVDSLAVILFVLQGAIFFILIFRVFLGRPVRLDKAAIACLAAAFLLAGWSFKRKIDWLNKGAVVIAQKSEARFEPLEGSTTHFVLRQGAKVEFLESTQSWVKIRRNDGKMGWVNKEAVELINNQILSFPRKRESRSS